MFLFSRPPYSKLLEKGYGARGVHPSGIICSTKVSTNGKCLYSPRSGKETLFVEKVFPHKTRYNNLFFHIFVEVG